MLLNFSGVELLLCKQPIDMRKSIDGLVFLIQDQCGRHPGDGTVYVFFNKHRNKVKLLYWDRNGFCLWYKRLEKERFRVPETSEAMHVISWEEFRWLMDGLDLRKVRGFKKLKYQHFC